MIQNVITFHVNVIMYYIIKCITIHNCTLQCCIVWYNISYKVLAFLAQCFLRRLPMKHDKCLQHKKWSENLTWAQVSLKCFNNIELIGTLCLMFTRITIAWSYFLFNLMFNSYVVLLILVSLRDLGFYTLQHCLTACAPECSSNCFKLHGHAYMYWWKITMKWIFLLELVYFKLHVHKLIACLT